MIGETTAVRGQELAGARPSMSRAEAQARYIAALASRAYSDEQMRLVAGAKIVNLDGDGLAELEHSIAALPSDEIKRLLEKMVADPTMLSERALAELASILGRHARPTHEHPRLNP